MKFIIVLITIAAYSPILANAKSVSSLSRVSQVTVEEGQTYREIRVSCTNHSETRYIRKQAGAFGWCVAHAPNQCSSNKVAAAEDACDIALTGVATKNAVVKKEPKKVEKPNVKPVKVEAAVKPKVAKEAKTEPVAKKDNRFEFEAELLEIEQKKIDLRRRELELTKKKLGIQKGDDPQ